MTDVYLLIGFVLLQSVTRAVAQWPASAVVSNQCWATVVVEFSTGDHSVVAAGDSASVSVCGINNCNTFLPPTNNYTWSYTAHVQDTSLSYTWQGVSVILVIVYLYLITRSCNVCHLVLVVQSRSFNPVDTSTDTATLKCPGLVSYPRI